MKNRTTVRFTTSLPATSSSARSTGLLKSTTLIVAPLKEPKASSPTKAPSTSCRASAVSTLSATTECSTPPSWTTSSRDASTSPMLTSTTPSNRSLSNFLKTMLGLAISKIPRASSLQSLSTTSSGPSVSRQCRSKYLTPSVTSRECRTRWLVVTSTSITSIALLGTSTSTTPTHPTRICSKCPK